MKIDTQARVQLSAISQPGDSLTGLLIARYGPTRTITLVQDDTIPEEMEADGIHPEDLAHWRARLAPAIRTDTVQRILDVCDAKSIHILTPEDPGWPAGLADLGPRQPVVLYLRGEHVPVQGGIDKFVAVVGARAATGYGEHVTHELVAELTDAGLTIVSGAAYGIDGAAHRTALAMQKPTVAYLAGGVDRPYPAGHAELLGRIAVDGAILSETPPGQSPTKWRFLMRNRLIAATAAVTVVAEAGHRSGSLNTAGHAAQLGRMVAAIPGPVTSVTSSGAHRLIRDHGASLVTNAADVLNLLRGEPEGPRPPALSGPKRTGPYPLAPVTPLAPRAPGATRPPELSR